MSPTISSLLINGEIVMIKDFYVFFLNMPACLIEDSSFVDHALIIFSLRHDNMHNPFTHYIVPQSLCTSTRTILFHVIRCIIKSIFLQKKLRVIQYIVTLITLYP